MIPLELTLGASVAAKVYAQREAVEQAQLQFFGKLDESQPDVILKVEPSGDYADLLEWWYQVQALMKKGNHETTKLENLKVMQSMCAVGPIGRYDAPRTVAMIYDWTSKAMRPGEEWVDHVQRYLQWHVGGVDDYDRRDISDSARAQRFASLVGFSVLEYLHELTPFHELQSFSATFRTLTCYHDLSHDILPWTDYSMSARAEKWLSPLMNRLNGEDSRFDFILLQILNREILPVFESADDSSNSGTSAYIAGGPAPSASIFTDEHQLWKMSDGLIFATLKYLLAHIPVSSNDPPSKAFQSSGFEFLRLMRYYLEDNDITSKAIGCELIGMILDRLVIKEEGLDIFGRDYHCLNQLLELTGATFYFLPPSNTEQESLSIRDRAFKAYLSLLEQKHGNRLPTEELEQLYLQHISVPLRSLISSPGEPPHLALIWLMLDQGQSRDFGPAVLQDMLEIAEMYLGELDLSETDSALDERQVLTLSKLLPWLEIVARQAQDARPIALLAQPYLQLCAVDSQLAQTSKVLSDKVKSEMRNVVRAAAQAVRHSRDKFRELAATDENLLPLLLPLMQ